ncbi:hypothetical protein FFRU_340040 [Fructobacillus fructosus]|uniref:hypothetical protein n=1 Tax=Fructobacillus fructosus TaxID=1631 RepID=UPI00021957FE|nr:hypothetical protein [Fructobacillus fructosus]GAP02075.1 hypothetical protein FFRU_340040 [Fructobacillus fructosus]
MVRKADKIWALYKGEDLLATGTIMQISRHTGKSCDHLMFMTYPVYKKRPDKGKKMQMIEVE